MQIDKNNRLTENRVRHPCLNVRDSSFTKFVDFTFDKSKRKNMNTKNDRQLPEYQDKDSAEERWKLIFDHHRDFIVDRMSPDFGLIDKLYSSFAITEDDRDEIKANRVVRKRNENLIKCLERKPKLGKLIQVLRESDQKHLVKYLENDGNYNDEFDGEWPLTDKEILTFKSNYDSLIDLVDTSDLIDRLYSTGVINRRQREFISSKSTSYEKNEALLEILRRGSLRSYRQTIDCLHQSNQSHIAEILETGGVAVRVDANLEIEDMDVGRLEEEIALQINNLLRNRSIPQSSRILERVLELKVIAAKKGHSVSLYFLCNQSNEVDHLEKMATDGRLKEFVEVLFNELIKTPKTIKITLKWTPDVFVKCREAVQEMKNSRISEIDIVDFPLELIDMILEKSYLLSILRQKESSHNEKDVVVIKQLASVDFCWFKRITRKHFKDVVWSKLKRYYENKGKQYLIYKNNQQFFDEIYQISGKTADHLINSESANGKRKRSLEKRQTENQMLRTAFLTTKNEDSIFEDFLSSYFPKERELIQEIVNTGGGAARVEIKMSRPLTEFDLIPQQFEDREMKILRSFADRDAVVWIWYHSNNALQKLNNRDKLKKLIEIVHQSVKATSDILEHKTNIDYDQLKKKIVSIPLVFADFRTTLNFKRENLSENISPDSDTYEVIDVTKVKMKIYVLCMIDSCYYAGNSSDSTMICVFEDRSPYAIVEEISLKRLYSYSRAIIIGISEFLSIVSSIKANCLYLLAVKSSRKVNYYVYEVIRIEIRESEQKSMKRISHWLELEKEYRPYALSNSRDGDLLMVNSSSPTILRIYESDAKLRLSVKLHEDILQARKAVETSNGNFIIIHSATQQTEDPDRVRETNEDNAIDEAQKKAFLWSVSEVSRDGKTINRCFTPQNQQEELYSAPSFYTRWDLCTDSEGRVFVADTYNHDVIVLDSCLRLIGSLIPQNKNGDENEKLRWPVKLFYNENSHEMIVAERYKVKMYDLIHK